MTVAEQQFEGEFRYVNSRLITNCEEIAFYNGSRREKMIIRDGFERLVRRILHRETNYQRKRAFRLNI